jgi:hypothetical protein
MKTNLVDSLAINLQGPNGPTVLKPSVTFVSEPAEEVRVNARLRLVNKNIFDLIQNIQKDTMEQRKQSYEDLKNLDVEVDAYYKQCMKMKVDRDVKSKFMDQIQEC